MKKKEILIVDDDRDFTESIKIILEKDGFKITTAYDGLEGLHMAAAFKPDLIILDVMLPLKDGYAICHELKSHQSTESIPILIVTSMGLESAGKQGSRIIANGHHADGYLEKPVDPIKLKEQVQFLLNQSEKQNQESAIKILLIDDDPDFVDAVKSLLDENGFDIVTSDTGEMGISLAETEHPDLILLDVMLPQMDGFAVCRYLKENKKTESIPIVMLTSIGSKLTYPGYARAIAVTHYADDYLEKPVESHSLLKVMRKYVGPMRRLV